MCDDGGIPIRVFLFLLASWAVFSFLLGRFFERWTAERRERANMARRHWSAH